MIKSFIKNSFIYTVGALLTRGIGIILIPIYTRYLTPTEYGVVDLFMILGSIVSLTIALEIFQAVARLYPEAEESTKKYYVSTAFWFTVFVYLLYFVISIIYADFFTIILLDDISYLNVYYLATGAITTSGFFYFTSNQLKWQLLPKKAIIVSILNLSIIAVISLYLLVFLNLKVESMFIAQIFANIIASGFSIYYARENYKFIFIYTKLKEMIELSFPLVFSSVSIFFALFIDRMLIKEFMGLEELGVYGLAYKFAAITSLVMIGFQSSLTPLVYRNYKEDSTPETISKLFNVFTILALVIVSGSILFSKELVLLMSTKDYYAAAPLIPIIVMAVFFSNMYIFAPGLGIAKKSKIITVISLINVFINGLLNYILIPIFGLEGAALATLVSSIIVFFVYVSVSSRYYFIPYDSKKLLGNFLMLVVITYTTNLLLNEITIFNFTLKLIVLCLVSFVSMYTLLSKDNMNKILEMIKINK